MNTVFYYRPELCWETTRLGLSISLPVGSFGRTNLQYHSIWHFKSIGMIEL